MLGRLSRVAILAEGSFTPMDAKTAVGVLRYRGGDVAAVIDSTRAGATAGACVGVGGEIPVVADVAAAAALGARALLLGIAPAGGRLPEPWRAAVEDALARGWDVVSGLHQFLGDDPELAALARAHGGRIADTRRPPERLSVGLARAASVDALVVLTVGSDCNVGKMTAALEIERALIERGARTAFVATGQTGIMIAGRGVAVDAVPADFVAGVTEAMVIEAARGADIVLVEGQGALHHPAFSGVTLGLLHGACPEALVLCHHAGRERMRIGGAGIDGPPIPPLGEVRDACERAAAWVRPARVVAGALNTLGLDDAAARAACRTMAQTLDVPVEDPVRFGSGPIADVLMERLAATRARRPVARA
jgi:uncharacterized NAD-dependent epimerase/dehydratase family protein